MDNDWMKACFTVKPLWLRTTHSFTLKWNCLTTQMTFCYLCEQTLAYIDPLNWSLSVIGCLQNNNFLSHVWWSAERWSWSLIGHILYTNDSSNTVCVCLFVGCESNLRFTCSLIRRSVTVRSARRRQLGVTETMLATTSQITNSKWWMRKSHLFVCFSSRLIMFLNSIVPSECLVSINEV